jgi:hypothetical protein
MRPSASGKHYILAVHYAGTRSRLEPIDGESVIVDVSNRSTYTVGDIYHVEAGAFHESLVTDGELAATLVRTELASKTSPRVLAPEAVVHEFTRDAADPVAARETLIQVIDRLAAGS